MKLDVVFVCQQGELEVMSALLAASLRHVCGEQIYLHALTPAPESVYGLVSPAVKNFLDGLGVKWYAFPNPISDEYKIFNKLNAFKITPQGDRILFLDSDIVIRRPLAPLEAYFSRPFAAKSGNKQRFSAAAEDWRTAYELFDLPVPEIRWPGSDSHEWGPPYFNAGVLLVDPALNFSEHWIEACRRIHFDERVKMENRGTVQVGLPVALYHRKIPYALLDQRFNFGLSKGWLQTRRPWFDEAVHVVHYFNPKNLTVDPVIHREVFELVQRFNLEEIFALSAGGQKLLKSFKPFQNGTARVVNARSSLVTPQSSVSVASLPPRRVYLTGIPRSGARLFAALLAEGLGVKVLTATESEAPVDEALVVMNTPEALLRLEQIVEDDPAALVFIFVREPVATIASWTASPDLKESMKHAAPLTEEQEQHLAQLENMPEGIMKHAGRWDYFATLTDVAGERVHILRYEDLTSAPLVTLEHVRQLLMLERKHDWPKFEHVHNHNAEARERLTAWEQECVRAICANHAGKFGYELYES